MRGAATQSESWCSLDGAATKLLVWGMRTMGELNPRCVVYDYILVLDVDKHSRSVDNSRRTCRALCHVQCYVRLGIIEAGAVVQR